MPRTQKKSVMEVIIEPKLIQISHIHGLQYIQLRWLPNLLFLLCSRNILLSAHSHALLHCTFTFQIEKNEAQKVK